jgi:hypothetical protein
VFRNAIQQTTSDANGCEIELKKQLAQRADIEAGMNGEW